MTIKETLKELLIDHGLFDSQADEVLVRMEADKDHNVLCEVFNKQSEGYPKVFIAAAWLTTKNEALKYIDEVCPRHWARPLFAEQQN